MSRVQKSYQRYERATRLIPGGTQLISRRPSRFAYGVSPVYAARGKGPRFWDIDGNEYIDWVSGIGAIILGYADEAVDETVREQISLGNCFSISHELELELAEHLVATIPCAEMVRYAKGGGEACAIAVRIARGVTGRDKVLFCGYHGWHDWYLAANLNASSALDEHLFAGIEAVGVPQSLAETSIPFPYGDGGSLGQLLDDHRGQIAAVIMEPLRSEMPQPGYLEQVAKLTRDHNALLIFDEVSTGFRPSAGGVQPVVGVTPDMAVFAKSISNGYPMGAVVGRRDVMELAGQMFISSTYWSDTIGLRAALTTLREIEKRSVPAKIDQLGRELKSLVAAAADSTGAPIKCDGVDFHPSLVFDVDDPSLHRQVTTLYIQEMAKRGCHAYPSFYLNAAQDRPELEQTAAALAASFAVIQDGLTSGRICELLQAETREDSFRRLVK